MFGYLPTKKDILDGGYEVDKSRIPFGIKDRIKINTEEKIRNIFLFNNNKKFNLTTHS